MSAGAQSDESAPIRVLIVDGVNNHDWQRTTAHLKYILMQDRRFLVEVATSPARDAPQNVWAEWRPPFAAHDVLLLNFNGGHLPDALHWPPALQASLEQYVEKGGGLAILHAANNAFPNWEAYQHMIGLGWRDKDFGPGLIVDAEETVLVVPVSEGRDPGHGPDHDFVMTTLATDHPITRGMPKRWLHPAEQLTHGQHGPAGGMTVLTYAYSKDTHENEVMDWVIPYGEGRVYVTMLGHLWKDETDINLRCVGFQTMLIRGVEWAATGEVHYPIPDNFPTATKIELGDPLD
jgi:type 1 glutamine amidotransferase